MASVNFVFHTLTSNADVKTCSFRGALTLVEGVGLCFILIRLFLFFSLILFYISLVGSPVWVVRNPRFGFFSVQFCDDGFSFVDSVIQLQFLHFELFWCENFSVNWFLQIQFLVLSSFWSEIIFLCWTWNY